MWRERSSTNCNSPGPQPPKLLSVARRGRPCRLGLSPKLGHDRDPDPRAGCLRGAFRGPWGLAISSRPVRAHARWGGPRRPQCRSPHGGWRWRGHSSHPLGKRGRFFRLIVHPPHDREPLLVTETETPASPTKAAATAREDAPPVPPATNPPGAPAKGEPPATTGARPDEEKKDPP